MTRTIYSSHTGALPCLRAEGIVIGFECSGNEPSASMSRATSATSLQKYYVNYVTANRNELIILFAYTN